MIITAKIVAIFFALATTAFCVSTIVLAVEKADLEDELQDALDKLDMISTTSTSTAAPAPTPSASPSTPDGGEVSTPGGGGEVSTPGGGGEISTPGGGGEVTPSSGTSSSASPTLPSWPTVPAGNPTFPTLPPGLPNPAEVIYRLPNHIRPIKYKIYIHPDLKAKTCEGSVSIQIEIDIPTNLIVMHSRDLKIGSISILNMMGRMRIRVKQFYLAPEREMLFIELEELLFTATPYVVSISYECELDGLTGVYSSTYLGAAGEAR